MVSSVVIHQMSKIEKQTISIILTKYKSIDKHMQATKDNQGRKKKSVMEMVHKLTSSDSLCTMYCMYLYIQLYLVSYR